MNTDDPYGHGTHVAGLAAGSRGKPGDNDDAKYLSNYGGVAPNANVINLRVLDSKGIGSSSGLLKALDWLLVNRTKYNIKVVNMSLGAPAIESYKNDPLCRATRKLVDAGVVVVAAAGNNGKNSAGQKLYGQIHAPGNEPSVITVGASNTLGTDARNDDIIATFSSRGPTRSYWTDASGVKHYDNLIKPDIVAPGNKLISAQGKNNLLVTTNKNLDVPATDKDDRDMMYLSGTSMAAPVVSGAAALMLQANPKLTPNMVKMILMYTSQPVKGYNMLEQGTGQLNVEGAVRLAKLVRKDLTASTPQGAPLLTTSTPPTPETTIGGYKFTWSQGIVLKYSYASGVELITKYQDIYDLGVVIGDGGVVGEGVVVGDGVVIGDHIVMSDGVVIGDQIMTSDGVVVGDGTVFCNTDILQGDGVVIGDYAVLGDGVVIGDTVVVGDGVVVGDSVVQAMSAMLGGDDGPGMN